MLTAIVATESSVVALVLRVLLGVVIFPHGAQKLLGWWGGYGYKGTMGFLTQTMKLPWIVGLLVIAIEFFGALGLIAGLFTRLAAVGVGAVMVGAILTVHVPHGFFMNWSGTQKGEGYEFHLLVLAIVAALVYLGGGAWSVDALLAR